MNGWIALHRKLLQNPIWYGQRFTDGQAWVDLLLRAAWADQQEVRGHRVVQVRRGQVLTSQVELARAWKWDRETVARYLRLLKSMGMIDVQTSKQSHTGYTLLTIIHYDDYQSGGVPLSSNGAGTDAGIQSSIHPATEPASMPHVLNKYKKWGEGEQEHARAGELTEWFTEFWGIYPRSEGQEEARREWLRLSPDDDLRVRIMTAVRDQARSTQWSSEGGRYVPFAAKWLKGRRWMDQPRDVNPPEPRGLALG